MQSPHPPGTRVPRVYPLCVSSPTHTRTAADPNTLRGAAFAAEPAPEVARDPAAERALLTRVLADESAAIDAVAANLGSETTHAIDLIVATARGGGNVLITGLGKSGLIGAKIAATLASLGVPAHAVHPTEAAHGDLGRFRGIDTVIALSQSGETEEVVALASVLKRDGLPLITITGGVRTSEHNSLTRLADAALRTGVQHEAEHEHNLAPTCSTTAALALGDALAVAAARRLSFGHADFARRHPGGTLGGLLRPVAELLRFRAGESLPVASPTDTVADAVRAAEAISRRPGAIVIVNPTDGTLAGIFTDADLRRLVLARPDALHEPIERVMTRNPQTLPADALARDAVQLVQQHRRDEIPVVDDANHPVGLLDVQDLVALRLLPAAT